VPSGQEGSDEWVEGIKIGVDSMLSVATKPDDVANLFKNNRSLFDALKAKNETVYAELMTQFSTTKKALTKE
jgi:hypothetical protein